MFVLFWSGIDYQNIQTGQRDEGSIYSLYSFFRKLTQGIGSSLVALALGWLGYQKELGSDQPQQVATDIKMGYVLFLLIGLAVMLLSVLIVYNINKRDEARIHDTLYKKDNAEPVLEGDGAVIPQEAKESVSDEIFETTAANTDNTDIINTDTENPDNDRDS